MNRLRSIIVCLGFSALFLLPLLQKLIGCIPDAPLDEKRPPTPAPVWSKSDHKNYLMGWQTWFNNRYPTRNFLIRLKTQIDYSVFSYSDKVHIGPRGWLFYRTVLDTQKPAIERISDDGISKIVGQLSTLRAWLAKRGITLVIVDCELKDEFYSQELPISVPRRPAHPRYHLLRKRIAAETGALVLDTATVLRRTQRERPTFHRTDFHWNDPAAFEVARSLVDTLAKHLGPPTRGWRWDLQIEAREFSGGQASFLPLLRPVRETSLFLHQTWPEVPRERRLKQEPFEYSQKLLVDDPTLLPPAVAFGDSFLDGMLRSGLADHFSAFHRVRFYHASLAQTLAAMPQDTRIFILEYIEVSVGALSIPIDYTSLPDVPATQAEPSQN